jgi:hypothetical protein
VSNPITQANASFQMRESADPRDHMIAGLRERIGSLETKLQDFGSALIRDGKSPFHPREAIMADDRIMRTITNLVDRSVPDMLENDMKRIIDENKDFISEVMISPDKISLELVTGRHIEVALPRK